VSTTSTRPEGSGTRILVIDSNVFFARRLVEALRNEQFEVVHATQAAYALTMLEWSPPAAILCSTNLQGIGAFDLPKLVHADKGTAHIPILAMGEGDGQALMVAFRAGCDDYIDRRVGPENVAAHVRVFLRSREEGFQPTQMLDSSETVLEGNLSHLDLPGIIQMLGHSRQDGALYINAGEIDGVISFAGGEVVHAEAGELIGDEAVVLIVKTCDGIDHGVYKFVPGGTSPTRTVMRSVTELMLEALRELDEQRERQHEGGTRS
jgi:CheY-like chemotaxis protein